MALNFSHRPFASHLSEEPMKIANGNWCSSFDNGRKSNGDSSSVDILDVLPSDPFGMDINNTFTAITGWLEDLDYNNQYGRRSDDIWIGDGNHQQLFAGLSFIWNNAMQFQSSGYSNGSESLYGFGGAFDGSLFSACKFPESSGDNNVFGGAFDGDGSCHGAFISASSVDEVLSLEDARNGGVVGSSDRCSNGGEDSNIHPAFGFCLYHLGVKDLLSVSMVCKSLHTTVCDDSLLWKHIHICQPLNEKITEEALLHLTERAQGTMQCLRLVDCCRITDDCLKRVLERNPQVVKLGVPGCTRITIDGILSILRDLKYAGKLQVKHLEIGGLFGVTKDHYDELFDLLNIDNKVEQTIQKPRFYHRGDACVSCDDDRALDIEMCPKCQNSRLVYDCPAEDCKGKKKGSEECRACSLCIQRCYHCGRCINDSEYEETFCLEFLCAVCSKPAPKLTL
ncbi:F-box-like domain superfamily [Arabidopsis thaliana x Arabidopsis arenosa]|uniref:F-box-like domain superfamily n=1 Tax=Arabidopsis thaliana x Arabidopsis arenosa TaxID=1240361 RepID=A0A8T1ZHW2_9BRAS|nr:F-box-like domain superfamily [Arabidopsis thaliana x Arabidopsis arenosa]